MTETKGPGAPKRPSAPKGVGTAGRKLWREITGKYDLRPDELSTLADACREEDLIARMQDKLDDESTHLIVVGSQGQPVANPMVSEIRQHRGTKLAILKALKLPDAPAGVGNGASRAADQRAWRGAS